jgi:hypothetical protein
LSSDKAENLPRLDLGSIGDGETVTPVALEVDLGNTEGENVEQLLVQGRTLNCEACGQAVKGLPDGFATKCVTIAKGGRSLLAPRDTIGLYVVKTDPGKGDGGLSGGAVAGIVIGVVGVAAGAVWFFVIKKGGDGSSNGAEA